MKTFCFSTEQFLVQSVLREVVILVSTRWAQTFEELRKIRNMVMLGSNDFSFLDEAEMVNRANTDGSVDAGINFVMQHGKPSTAYLVKFLFVL